MHTLAFMYPNAAGHVFDVEHWKNVHLPLGLGLADKHLGLRPSRIMLFAPIRGGDLTADSAVHGAIAACIFDQRESAERFSTLFEFEEAARRLSADFPNYTAGPPGILVADISDVTDIDGMIEAFKRSEP